MKHLQNQRGFSLIEIMVALVLGLTLVMAFTGALIVGLQTEAGMDDRMYATRTINSVIEELRNENLSGEIDEDTIRGLSSFQEYEEELKIEDGDVNKEEDNLYSIKISWPDRNYSTEALVATGIKPAGENGGENGNDNGDNGNGEPHSMEFYGNLPNGIGNEPEEIKVIIKDENGVGLEGQEVDFEIFDDDSHNHTDINFVSTDNITDSLGIARTNIEVNAHTSDTNNNPTFGVRVSHENGLDDIEHHITIW